jgi:deoxycytidine triphosphate deaminase
VPNNFPPKYAAHKSKDPFPEIPAALLNSADIEDYARELVLLDPFSGQRLKSASYEVETSGAIYLWNPKTKTKDTHELKQPGDYFDLQPNSIAYIFLGTTFYLPDYIAIRFNLKITHVHRGLLLGTGPLVDPGFCGRLLIPLHNLTSNPYRFEYGKGLIWVEFTKLSPDSTWTELSNKSGSRMGVYRPFPKDKVFLTPENYFEKANHGNPIISSIPEATESAKQSAASAAMSAGDAAKRVETLQRRIYISGVVGALALVAALAALIYAGYQLNVAVNATVQDSMNYVRAQRDTDRETAQKLTAIEHEMRQIKATAGGQDVTSRIARIEAAVQKLQRDRPADGRARTTEKKGD